MFNRIKALLHRWSEVKEIDSLTDRDLADLGLSRAQVLAFAQMPSDISDRVAAMGAIFGIPKADLTRDHAQWVDLLETCGPCSHRAACSAVLAKADQSHPSDCGFCLNHASFAAMAPKVA